jgi:hypothetical protein
MHDRPMPPPRRCYNDEGVYSLNVNSYGHDDVSRDMEKAPFAVLFFGMAAISAGVAQVLAHNAWDTLPEVIVSLLGWGLLLKGLVCTVAPGIADRGGDIVVESKLMPAAGASVLIIGAYLSWLGYFV